MVIISVGCVKVNSVLPQSVTVVFCCVVCVDSDPDKHYLMEEHERVPITVCEKEPSSIIAFALRCEMRLNQ